MYWSIDFLIVFELWSNFLMYWSDQARIQKLPRVKVLPGRGLPIFGKFTIGV